MDQIEFNFPVLSDSDQDNIDALVKLLKDAGTWLNASEIARRFGLADTENNRRRIRDWASNSGGWIISWQRGYCHAWKSTLEDWNRYEHATISQIRAMGHRLAQSRRRFHSRIG